MDVERVQAPFGQHSLGGRVRDSEFKGQHGSFPKLGDPNIDPKIL